MKVLELQFLEVVQLLVQKNSFPLLVVAVLLLLGFTYEEIVQLLGVGKNKISAVHQTLERGGEGYKLLITRIIEKRKKRKIQGLKQREKSTGWREKPDVERIKKRYPGALLFWNIFEEFSDDLEIKRRLKGDKEEAAEYYTSHHEK